MWNIFSNDLNNINNPNSAVNSLLEDPINSVANVFSATVGKQTLNVSQEALKYQKQLYAIFVKQYEIADSRYKKDEKIFSEIIELLIEINKNQIKTNEFLENLLQNNK